MVFGKKWLTVLVLAMVFCSMILVPVAASATDDIGQPAAPAIAAELLRAAGVKPIGPYVSEVARAMGQGATFNGIDKSDVDAYRAEVEAFLSELLPGKLARASFEMPPGASRKIVVFKASVTNESTKNAVLRRVGVQKVQDLRLINATAVLVTADGERALRQSGEVLRIDPDVKVHAIADPAVTGKPGEQEALPQSTQEIPWGIDKVRAPYAWATSVGAGVRVAIIDTGIQLNHPDLAANVKGGVNIIKRNLTPNDDNGHGTHVAGIVAALGNTIGVVGVAPRADLFAVKVLDRFGGGYLSDVVKGIEWSVNNGMKVANMSLGTTVHVQSLKDAVDEAYARGLLMVAAAGNTGAGVSYPAAYGSVIAVSATDTENKICTFSSRGSEIELAAPGLEIGSTYVGSSYAVLSGTSMASPHVSGTAALVLAANGSLSNVEVRQRLADTAYYLGTPIYYGHGLVDAAAAVGAAIEPGDTYYELGVNISGFGAVTRNPDYTSYLSDTTVWLTAVPSIGWTFIGWQGDLSGSANPQSIIMDSSKSVTAVFEEDTIPCALSVSLHTDRDTYPTNSWVKITVMATSDDVVEGAQISLSIAGPNGVTVMTAQDTTNASGEAYFRYRVPNRAQKGTYTVTAVGTKEDATAEGVTEFEVQY